MLICSLIVNKTVRLFHYFWRKYSVMNATHNRINPIFGSI